jgi:hypothetical protein
VKVVGEVRDILLYGGGKSINFLQGSSASLNRTSEQSNMKVKILGWLEIVAPEKGRGISIS